MEKKKKSPLLWAWGKTAHYGRECVMEQRCLTPLQPGTRDWEKPVIGCDFQKHTLSDSPLPSRLPPLISPPPPQNAIKWHLIIILNYYYY
jgi:hypothetical protein